MAKQRILIVDDEPKVAFFFQKNLEMIGDDYIVATVNSGADALNALQMERYDLMITDLRMPNMDGLELLNRVRELSPETKTILVTAYGSADVWDEAKRLDTFALSKPIKIPDLLAAVRDTLKQAGNQKTRSGIMTLSGENYKLLTNSLENLRVNVGARATVLADTTGRVLVKTGTIEEFDLSAAMALLGGTMAASNALVEHLKYQKPTYLSYFEGPPYDLYATNVSENFFLTIMQDRRKEASRIGLVWLYTQRTLKELAVLLGRDFGQDGNEDLGQGFAESVRSELNNLFGDEDDFAVATPAPVKEKPAVSVTKSAAKRTTSTLNLGQRVEQMLALFGKQTGLATESRLEDLEGISNPVVVKLVLKAVSEGLKNVYQHAKATVVGVSFLSSDGVLQGRVADDGIGFNMNHPPHLSTLARLQKEFENAGGQLELSAYPAQGTNLIFELKL